MFSLETKNTHFTKKTKKYFLSAPSRAAWNSVSRASFLSMSVFKITYGFE